MFRILTCAMLAFSAHASIVMMEISAGGVDISGNYNPFPSSTNTTTSAGVNLEVASSGIASADIKYVPVSPPYPANGGPLTILVEGAGQATANGTYSYHSTVNGRPTYKKGNYYWITFDIFNNWQITYTEFATIVYYDSGRRTTFPSKSSWFKVSGSDNAPTLVYDGGEEPTSAPPDMVVTEPTNGYPTAFASFTPTVAPVAPKSFTPVVSEFTRQAGNGDTIALTGEDL